MRGEALDHILFHGPPGLENHIVQDRTMKWGEYQGETSGPVIEKPADLAGLLTSLEPNDVFSSMRSTG